MIKTMKKSLVLAAAIAAMSAIAVPSMASAANWGPVGTYHTLTSPSSITFNIPSGPGGATYGFSCASGPRFSAQVRTPASPLMDLTSTTTLSCTGTATMAGCNVALALNGLPLWNADATSGASNVKINSVNIEGSLSGSCGGGGSTFTVSGQLAGGVWSNLNRSLAFTNGTGLNLTFTGSPTPYPVTVTASEFIKDTTSPFVGL
jgi:hypothetical protein